MKKLLAIIMVIILSLSMVACKAESESTVDQNINSQGSGKNAILEEHEIITVVDHSGLEVSLPKTIERVVITSPWPLPSVYAIFWGSADKIVGIDPAALSGSREFIWNRVAPEMMEVETDFLDGETVNAEELIKLEPDVVFYIAGDQATLDILNELNIPGVGFSVSKWGFNSIETANGWMKLLEDIFPEQGGSTEYIEYGNAIEQMVLDRTKNIADGEKPKILFLRECNDSSIATYGSKQFAQYWTDTIGGINVSGGQDIPGYEITMEQIYEWDPDIIFVTDFTRAMPEDLYNNRFEGQDWSGITAIKEQKVYKLPNGLFRWYPASAEAPLALQWFAVKTHPNLFPDINIDQEIKEYYKTFFNIELTDKDVEEIYNTPAEVAEGVQ